MKNAMGKTLLSTATDDMGIQPRKKTSTLTMRVLVWTTGRKVTENMGRETDSGGQCTGSAWNFI